MTPADLKDFDGQFVVVETEDNWYLGTIRLDLRRRELTVYTGFTGRPPVLPFDEVETVTRADEHPHVAAA